MDQRARERTTGQTIRSVIVQEASRRAWLYVGLVETGFENWDDEQDYLRSDGAVDALLDLARELGLQEQVRGAEEQGRRELREHMVHRQAHGPARLQELALQIERIEREVPLHDYKRDSRERESRGYYKMRDEKLSIEGDLEIADLTIRYLDGEDVG